MCNVPPELSKIQVRPVWHMGVLKSACTCSTPPMSSTEHHCTCSNSTAGTYRIPMLARLTCWSSKQPTNAQFTAVAMQQYAMASENQ